MPIAVTPGAEVPMTLPLVETKLFRPASRPGAVPRPLLTDRLSRADRVVLLSAPAGFGKTTLLVRWLTGADTAASAGWAGDPGVAWVSLDEGDREAASFWAHLLTALDRAVPGAGAGALVLLQNGSGRG
jgi:LuxR family maltose regulon positive regulatory protein